MTYGIESVSATQRLDPNFVQNFEYGSPYSENATLLNIVQIDPIVSSTRPTITTKNFTKLHNLHFFAFVFILSNCVCAVNPVIARSIIELVKFDRNRKWSEWFKGAREYTLENGGYELYDIVSDTDFISVMGMTGIISIATVATTLFLETRTPIKNPAFLLELPALVAKYNLPQILDTALPMVKVDQVGVSKLFSASKFVHSLPSFTDKMAEALFSLWAAYTYESGYGHDTPQGIPACAFSPNKTASIAYLRDILSEGKTICEFFVHHAIERENWDAMEMALRVANMIEDGIPGLIRFCMLYGATKTNELYGPN